MIRLAIALALIATPALAEDPLSFSRDDYVAQRHRSIILDQATVCIIRNVDARVIAGIRLKSAIAHEVAEQCSRGLARIMDRYDAYAAVSKTAEQYLTDLENRTPRRISR